MRKVLILLLCFCLCGCGTVEKQLNEQQVQCEHEWTVLYHIFLDMQGNDICIYCPKCELEKNLKYKEWRKIQVDTEYKNGEKQ